jgi:enoyl-CoA hydratase/carnithine racemase
MRNAPATGPVQQAGAAPVSFHAENGVALVRLERPDKRNAWNVAMRQAYRAAMARAERDRSVRVVVVTGAGDTFCVGGDMDVLDTLADRGTWSDDPAVGEVADPFGDDLGAFAYMQRMSKPVIAAINGPAAGTGLILACFCDMRFAAAGAKLTTAMSRLGLPAEEGLSWILPRLVGTAHAFDLLIASEVIPAERALQLGLVNCVISRDTLLDKTLLYARRLAATISPASMRMIKQQIYADWTRELPASIATATTSATAALTSADFREGITAFREHRAPRFAPPA